MQGQVSGPALTTELIPGRDCAMANGPAREQYLLEFIGAAAGGPAGGFGMSARTPLNLCLVIDRSGSMQGPKLEAAKESARATAEVLSPNDYIAVVAFDSEAQIFVHPTRASNKMRISNDIARLQSGGGTGVFLLLLPGLVLFVLAVAAARLLTPALRLLELGARRATPGCRACAEGNNLGLFGAHGSRG